MQGLWKDKRKHFIRDKFKYINKSRDKKLIEDGILTIDKEYEFRYEVRIKEKWVQLYNIAKVNYFDDFNVYHQNVWLDNNMWRTLDGAFICYNDNVLIESKSDIVKYQDNCGYCYTEDSHQGQDIKECYYGKPLEYQGKWWKRGNTNKKYWSNKVQKSERQIVKKWIKKEDFESAIRHNPHIKSIDWLIA